MPIRLPLTWMEATPHLGKPRLAPGGMEPDSPIPPAAAGSLPSSSPSRKGVERRFEAADRLLADRLAAGLFGIAAQGLDAVGRRPVAAPSGSGRVSGDGPCRAAALRGLGMSFRGSGGIPRPEAFVKRKHNWLLHKPQKPAPPWRAHARAGRTANSGRRTNPARGFKRADRAVHRIERGIERWHARNEAAGATTVGLVTRCHDMSYD